MRLPLAKWFDMPPLWLLLFLALARASVSILPLAPRFPLLGAALVLIGLGVIAMAALQFRRHRTTIIPHQQSSALLTRGLYAYSRNPIYLADALILAGACLYWGALSGVILVPLFAWIIQSRFIAPEEARLAATFGIAFESYCSETRRWL